MGYRQDTQEQAGGTLRAAGKHQGCLGPVPVAVPVVWSATGPAVVPVPLLCRCQVPSPLAASPQLSTSKEQESLAPQGPAVCVMSSSPTSPRKPSCSTSKATCPQAAVSDTLCLAGAGTCGAAPHPVPLLARGGQCCPCPVPDAALGSAAGPQHHLLSSLWPQLEVQGTWAEGGMGAAIPQPLRTPLSSEWRQAGAALGRCHGARTNLWARQAVPEGETAWGSGRLLVGAEEQGPLPVAPWHRGVHGQEVA